MDELVARMTLRRCCVKIAFEVPDALGRYPIQHLSFSNERPALDQTVSMLNEIIEGVTRSYLDQQQYAVPAVRITSKLVGNTVVYEAYRAGYATYRSHLPTELAFNN